MRVLKLRPGLWYWSAPHPDWTPDAGWPQEVGCVYYEAPDTTILIDPMVPADDPDRERFWRALDGDVERRGVPVTVFLTCSWHDRSAQLVLDRYAASAGASIWAHEACTEGADCTTSRTFTDEMPLPGGLRPFTVTLPDFAHTVYLLPEHAALAAGDVILGPYDAHPFRVAPRSWFGGENDGGAYHAHLAPHFRRLAELPLDRILPAHGEPVTESAGARLKEAINEALSHQP
jgi:hypothetical protein